MLPDHLGPYRIEKLLGSGGMGSVYAGVNDQTGERAAVKVLAPQIATDENFRARFESEIETLKKLKHPHIVQLYGFGEHEGQLFYSMELVEGDSLQEKLKHDGPFQWREAVAIGIEVAMALKHAHDRGIIHRDLKPANLLIDPNGQVKLTDFGIAKLFGGNSLTAAGGVMGTADYMAPEQAEGVTVNHRVDLYSLGGVLYALLTGRPPFLGNSLVEVLDMLKHDTPTPVSRLMPDIPRPIDGIVLHLLAKNPKQRIPTALAAANQLRSLSHALSPDRTAIDEESDFQVADSATKVTPPSEESARIASRETAFIPPSSRSSDSGTAQEAPEQQDSKTSKETSQKQLSEKYFKDTADDAPAPRQSSDSQAENSHFTTISAEELGADDRSQFEFDDDSIGWPRLAALAMAIVIIALLGWYSLQKPTAAALWSEIESIVDDDDPRRIADAQQQLEQFVTRFPDHERSDQARAYLEEIEFMRLERRLEREMRRSTGSQSTDVAEQLYQAAMSHAPTNPHRAVEQLESLVALYAVEDQAGEQNRQIVELARFQLDRLKEAAAQWEQDHRDMLAGKLELAESQRQSDSKAAREIYQAIIALYAEKSWAESYVGEARHQLAEMEVNSASDLKPETDEEDIP